MTRRFRNQLWLLYWVVIFAATHVPPGQHLGSWHIMDKFVHALMFALLTVLGIWARRPDGWAQVLSLAGIIVLYAAADELTQPLSGRSAEWFDWLADLTGILAGAVLAGRWSIARRAS